MTQLITRRGLIGTAFAASLSVAITTNLCADEPAASIAVKRELLKNLTPIASRTIRLRPVTAELPRAVVTAIASDPRGKVVAVAGDDHAIRILDATTMRVRQTLTGHRDLVRTLTFDPQGETLVSAGNDGQLIVWDRDNKFKVSQKMQGTPALACVRFAPSGKEMAAVGFDNAIFIIGRGRKDNPTFSCDCKDLRAVAYRDDNRLLAVAGRSGDLHLFDPESGELVFEQNIHSGRIHDLKFMPESNVLISVGEDGALVVFNTSSGEKVKSVRVSTGKLFAVSIMDSVHVAVAGSDNVVRVVDTSAGKIVRSLKGHVGSIPTLAFNNGHLFSGGYDATLRRWALHRFERDQERIAEGDHALDR